MIRELSYVIEEGCHHIILDSKLRHLVICVLCALISNHVLKNVGDSLLLLLIVKSLSR